MKKRIKWVQNHLVDARAMSLQHPETFHYPAEEAAQVVVGSTVKVCNDKERFWVNVVAVEGDLLVGIVEMVLIKDRIKSDDAIGFERRHIYQVHDHRVLQAWLDTGTGGRSEQPADAAVGREPE